MRNILQSRMFAWLAMIFVIIILIFTFAIRMAWWQFIDIFCAFMMAFCNLIAVYTMTRMPYVGKKLQRVAGFFGILTIIAFIVEFIFDQIYGG